MTKYLSSDDIVEINRFFGTPTGKKWVSLAPVMTQEAQKFGEEMGRALVDQKTMIKILQDLMAEFPSWFVH